MSSLRVFILVIALTSASRAQNEGGGNSEVRFVEVESQTDERSQNLRASASCQVPHRFRCAGDGTCIPVSRVCDGYHDCSGGLDELYCSAPAQHRRRPRPVHAVHGVQGAQGAQGVQGNRFTRFCGGVGAPPPNMFRCPNTGGCMPQAVQCNGWDDCGDGSDEAECDYGDYGQEQGIQSCPTGQFACKSVPAGQLTPIITKCIPDAYKCNGHQDCSDGQDEGPAAECCPQGQVRCTSRTAGTSICAQRCNGTAECSDNRDEHQCPRQ